MTASTVPPNSADLQKCSFAHSPLRYVQVQAEVAALIQGRILVGHAITNDLTVRAPRCSNLG